MLMLQFWEWFSDIWINQAILSICDLMYGSVYRYIITWFIIGFLADVFPDYTEYYPTAQKRVYRELSSQKEKNFATISVIYNIIGRFSLVYPFFYLTFWEHGGKAFFLIYAWYDIILSICAILTFRGITKYKK